MTVRIIADENIPQVREAFAALGDLQVLPTHQIDAAAVKHTEILLVRSTLKVDQSLLAGSAVKFVATATIGADHIDTRWLDKNGIQYASAPGCNADSVVQWFAATILALCEKTGRQPSDLLVAIIGVGQVGSRIARLVGAFSDHPPLLCDPLNPNLEEHFGDWPEMVRIADVVTLHVPLTQMFESRCPTHHLVNRQFLSQMPPNSWLINSSRGAVVDTPALIEAIDQKQVVAALDVWENEPSPDFNLVNACAVATPHIAGHSLEGKLRGTEAIYRAVCSYLGIHPTWTATYPACVPEAVELIAETVDRQILRAISYGYKTDNDINNLRSWARLENQEQIQAFKKFRSTYPVRREVSSGKLTCSHATPELVAALTALGLGLR